MKRYNFDVLMKHIVGGSVLRDNEGDITYRRAIAVALLSDPMGAPATGDQKYARFVDAQKVQNATTTTKFKSEEIARIKEHIGIVSSTLLVGLAHDFLENGDIKDEPLMHEGQPAVAEAKH